MAHPLRARAHPRQRRIDRAPSTTASPRGEEMLSRMVTSTVGPAPKILDPDLGDLRRIRERVADAGWGHDTGREPPGARRRASGTCGTSPPPRRLSVLAQRVERRERREERAVPPGRHRIAVMGRRMRDPPAPRPCARSARPSRHRARFRCSRRVGSVRPVKLTFRLKPSWRPRGRPSTGGRWSRRSR